MVGIPVRWAGMTHTDNLIHHNSNQSYFQTMVYMKYKSGY